MLGTAATSTNRILVGSQSLRKDGSKRENFEHELSLIATPALNSNSKLKKENERIKLGVGSSKDKLARGSQDESKYDFRRF